MHHHMLNNHQARRSTNIEQARCSYFDGGQEPSRAGNDPFTSRGRSPQPKSVVFHTPHGRSATNQHDRPEPHPDCAAPCQCSHPRCCARGECLTPSEAGPLLHLHGQGAQQSRSRPRARSTGCRPFERNVTFGNEYEYTFEDKSGNQARPTGLNYVNPHHSQSNLNEFPGEGPDRAGKDPIRGHDRCHNGTTSTREDRTRPRRELRWTPELPTTQHRHNGTTSTREDRTRPRRELRWTPELPTTQRYYIWTAQGWRAGSHDQWRAGPHDQRRAGLPDQRRKSAHEGSNPRTARTEYDNQTSELRTGTPATEQRRPAREQSQKAYKRTTPAQEQRRPDREQSRPAREQSQKGVCKHTRPATNGPECHGSSNGPGTSPEGSKKPETAEDVEEAKRKSQLAFIERKLRGVADVISIWAGTSTRTETAHHGQGNPMVPIPESPQDTIASRTAAEILRPLFEPELFRIHRDPSTIPDTNGIPDARQSPQPPKDPQWPQEPHHGFRRRAWDDHGVGRGGQSEPSGREACTVDSKELSAKQRKAIKWASRVQQSRRDKAAFRAAKLKESGRRDSTTHLDLHDRPESSRRLPEVRDDLRGQ